MELTDEQMAMIDSQPTFETKLAMADYLYEDPLASAKMVGGLMIVGTLVYGSLFLMWAFG